MTHIVMFGRNRRRSKTLLWLETLLWAGGAFFATIYLYYWFDRNIAQWRYEKEMDQEIATETKTPERPRPNVGDLLGEIEVPRVGVSAAIVEGEDEKTLMRAVGHLPGTALPGEKGRVALAGHRDTFFRGLRTVRANDRILLKTPSKEIYEYRVEKTEIVKPDNLGVLAPSDQATLTLVTCYPFQYVGNAPLRYIVHARLAPSNEDTESKVSQAGEAVKRTHRSRASSRAASSRAASKKRKVRQSASYTFEARAGVAKMVQFDAHAVHQR